MQIETAQQRGVLTGIVLADAGYGNNTAFREGIEALGLQYIVGVNLSTNVRPPRVTPLPPKPRASGTRGRAPSRHRYAKGHEPLSCEQVALEVDEQEREFVEWREGTNETLSGWFIALRVRAARSDHLTNVLREKQCYLVEWPEGEEAPTKYSLSTLPATASLQDLVHSQKTRRMIERNYKELKDEIGLNHYEGRNWRGFHHHASLCIATYGFLVAERLTHPAGRKKSYTTQRTCLTQKFRPVRFPREHNVMWITKSVRCVGELHKPSLKLLFDVPAALIGQVSNKQSNNS